MQKRRSFAKPAFWKQRHSASLTRSARRAASAEQFLVNGIVHILEDVKNNIHGFLLAFSVIHNLAYGALRSLSVEAMENAYGNTAEGHAVTLFPAARLRQER